MQMKNILRMSTALTTGALALMALAAPVAQAQTVVNLTNFEGSLLGLNVNNVGTANSGTANTTLDIWNNGDAASTGGLFGGAANILNQAGTNLLNSIGVTSNGSFAPVVLGTAAGSLIPGDRTVEINTLTAAGTLGTTGTSSTGLLSSTSSMTVVNTNTAVLANPNIIPNLNPNAGILLGYAAGPAAAGGSQNAVNVANGVGAGFASGTIVSLNQQPVGIGVSGEGGVSAMTQGGNLNMSAVNTLLAATANGTATVTGSGYTDGSGNVFGVQNAQNRLNAAAIYGDVALSVAQKANEVGNVDAPVGLQSVNSAVAFNSNLGSAGIDPQVRSVRQAAGVDINTLALGTIGSATSGAVTLNGIQTVGTGGIGPNPVTTNSLVASTNPLSVLTSPLPGGSFSAASALGFNSQPRAINGAPAAANVGLTDNAQTISVAYNRVDAGAVAITALPTTGDGPTSAGTGFTQTFTTVGVPTGVVAPVGTGYNYAALNNAVTDTLAGSATIAGLAQNYQLTANTVSSAANITGGIAQTGGVLQFAAGTLYPTAFTSNVNAGPTAGSAYDYGSIYGNAGNFALGLAANNAVAANYYGGNASASGVSQQTRALVNVLSTTGAVDTTSAGAIEQGIGGIYGFGSMTSGEGAPMQSIAAVAGNYYGSGQASNVGYAQVIGLTANMLGAGTGGLAGNATQTANNVVSDGAINSAAAVAGLRGGATLGATSTSSTASGTQLTSLMLNRIDSAGTIGSVSAPAALNQASTDVNLGRDLFMNSATNVAQVVASGLSGSAAGNNLVQQAGVNVNSLAATGAMVGNATQLSTRFASANGNSATANAAGGSIGPAIASGCEGFCNGTSNATLLGASQLTTQSLNTMTLAGGATGRLNQVASGGTDLLSANTLRSQSNSGYAVNSGVQSAINTVNVISAVR
jgi:hypothetical protein